MCCPIFSFLCSILCCLSWVLSVVRVAQSLVFCVVFCVVYPGFYSVVRVAQNLQKIIFVRDPFERILSAYRD
jgi:hypothetical protein